MLKNLKTLMLAAVAAGSLANVAFADDAADLLRYREAEKIGQQRLAAFDTLDFDVFTKQQWDRLKESHSADIKVYWPDGHMTTGLDVHTNDLKYMFTYAPDTRVSEHPVKLQDGEWTSVIGTFEGTFTKPMKLADGTEIAPTGKAFSLKMVTVGHWSPEGVMDEEYLFWDNMAFMKQVGLDK
jgi:hypothetical protein